jgi:hypothetical protein
MTQSTLQEFEQDLGRDIERLTEGDAFRVDCHDEQLTVHSDVEFSGAVVLDVCDSDGRHLPIGRGRGVVFRVQSNDPDWKTTSKQSSEGNHDHQSTVRLTSMPGAGVYF